MCPDWFFQFIARFRQRDSIDQQHAWLIRFGRITDGMILDFQQDETGTTIFYQYRIANVGYETSQRLSPGQIDQRHLYAPGSYVTVRFDPKNPGHSIVQ
jgi:Protein of unknown function (DUF3592)